MSRTARADAIMSTLPAYYVGEDLIERVVQAWANEVDRLDALVTKLETELQPGAATDDLGLLGIWEALLGLPVRPAGASQDQRLGKVVAALRSLDAFSSADVLSVMSAAVGSEAFSILRDTPDPLKDVLAIPFLAGTYNAALIESIARRAWPAHRQLFIRYSDGFILEVSRLDVDSF